jgi:DNA-binding YbaB/EbfC family protein
MFGDLMGNMEEKQRELDVKLTSQLVFGTDPAGAVKVEANAKKEVLNISIDADKLDLSDKEQVEDYVLLAVNDALSKADEEAKKMSQSMVNDLLPGGLGGLSNLFG